MNFKILTWNIRGLGTSIKRKVMRCLILDRKIVLCLQECMLEVTVQKVIRHIWGGGKVVLEGV